MKELDLSPLDRGMLIAALITGSAGIVLALVFRNFSYVAETIELCPLIAALVVLKRMSDASNDARIRTLGLVVLALLAGFAITGLVLLLNFNQRLAEKSTKLSILDVVNREPLLVSADAWEIESCFERDAIVKDVSLAGEKSEWHGIAKIVERYQEVGQDWQLVSMHAHPNFHKISQDHATVETTSYIRKPGRDTKWYQALAEAWELHRRPGGDWKIQAFYYGVSPKDVSRYLQSDINSMEDGK